MTFLGIIFFALFFIFGLIIGSFLNVVILRYSTRSLGGRSACMVCQSTLAWYELIPLFSFIALRGRCKSCKSKISWQYPLVELICGLVFAGLFFKLSALSVLGGQIPVFAFTYAYYALCFCILIVIGGYDIRHKIIPDTLSLAFGALAFLGLFLFSGFVLSPHIPTVSEFLSGILIALPFVILWLVSRGAWMGLGDGKLILGLGWFLGLALGITAVVLAFWIGAIIGVGLMFIAKKYNMKSEIPFAPYLILGTFIVFFFSINLLML